MKKFMFLGFIAATMFSLSSCDLLNEVEDAIGEITEDQAPEYKEEMFGKEGGR